MDERAEFQKLTNVSRETFSKFERYELLLKEWQAKFNLVAPSTLPHIWNRHFLDSAQLFAHLPAGTRSLVDIGSGAGFPGLVLAIMGVPEVHLIEATQKKARFLETVAKELELSNVTVHAVRAESIKDLKTDLVTARAVAPLKELMPLIYRFLGKNGQAILLKGQHVVDELKETTKSWKFRLEKQQSLSDPSGIVLKMSEIVYAASSATQRRRKNKARHHER